MALTTEEAAPVTSFVAAAPNSNYILNERKQGEPLVGLLKLIGMLSALLDDRNS